MEATDKYTRCERCGAHLTGQVFSDPRCNDVGHGVELCGDCANFCDFISDEDFAAKRWHLSEIPRDYKGTPFDLISKPADARLLAMAVLAAHDSDEVWACCRMVRRTHHGRWVGGYLNGKHFVEYVYEGQIIAFQELQNVAARFLSED